MLQRVETWHYKCLKKIDVNLEPVNILIGPNASGKSTLLDVLDFLRDALADNVESAVRKRGSTLEELVWNQARVEDGFEIAIEVNIPEELNNPKGYQRVRYEVGVGLDPEIGIYVKGENLWLIGSQFNMIQPSLFPDELNNVRQIVHTLGINVPNGSRLVTHKTRDRKDYLRAERATWEATFQLDPKRLVLSGLPDVERFPIASWFRQFLNQNIYALQLNSRAMRRPAPYDVPKTFQPDGSNLPMLVDSLRKSDEQRFNWWIGHLQTVLEDLETVIVRERPEDRARYLEVGYRNGLCVPSWMLSDGTLRLLALTLIAYLPNKNEIFLIEEPENGMHPKAIEAVFQALSSVYDSQVFLATHSPLFLSLANYKSLLIFSKTPSGATDVVRGPNHPILAEWDREGSLATLFAAGVLG